MKLFYAKSGLFSATLLLLVLQPVTAPAGASAHTQLPCSSHGPISVNTLPAQISLRNCLIQGRLLVITLPNGSAATGVHIPRAGMGIGAATLTTNGEYQLTATNANGTLSIQD